jgi:hypothetical protein
MGSGVRTSPGPPINSITPPKPSALWALDGACYRAPSRPPTLGRTGRVNMPRLAPGEHVVLRLAAREAACPIRQSFHGGRCAGFGFFRQGDSRAWPGRKRPPERKLRLGGSKDGVWVYSEQDRESKMEIPVYVHRTERTIDANPHGKTEILACNSWYSLTGGSLMLRRDFLMSVPLAVLMPSYALRPGLRSPTSGS